MEDFKNVEEEMLIEKTELERIEDDNLKNNRLLFKRYILFFLCIFLLVGSFFAGYEKGKKNVNQTSENVTLTAAIINNKNQPTGGTVDFSLFWKVWDLLKEKYVDKDKLDAQQLVYGAISGMLKATDDPYTSFFDPKQSKDFSENIEGSFDGIGVELGVKDGILTIIAPLDGSPAQKAGMRSGDKILKVGDKTIADLTIDEAIGLIRGKKGTPVVLTVLHEGEKDTADITVIRDTIEVHSVTVSFKDKDVAYVRISQFSDNTDREFDDAVNQIIAQKSKGIILDLRDNPGGLLDKAVDIASRMIPRAQVVVSEEDYTGKKDSLYTSGGDKLSSLPLVVLINEGSASASEILSGALKDDRGITLVGKKSFGKGCVQQLINLPGGSSVKITVAKWLTPKGDYIMDKGITPDDVVELTRDDIDNNRDPQFDKALETLKIEIK